MSKLLCSTAILATTLAMLAPAPARAETYDKLTYLTFSGTVQVPGAMLKPGTYRFHLTNPETSRNVMQVLSGNGDVVYAMFHTIPDIRSQVTLDPAVTFKEVPANVAPPINTVFYGGETIGYEFLYPKDGIDMTPMVFPQPPITYTYLETPKPIADAAPERRDLVRPPDDHTGRSAGDHRYVGARAATAPDPRDDRARSIALSQRDWHPRVGRAAEWHRARRNGAERGSAPR
jgi:hypothetical protein